MKHAVCGSVLCALAMWAVVPASVLGQGTSSPDVVVDLNEAIYEYLQGSIEAEYYQRAIERLTSVVNKDPENAPALLFRALSYGRQGLLHRRKKDDSATRRLELEEIIRMREHPERRAEIESEIARYEGQVKDASLRPAERVPIRYKLNELSDLLQLDRDYSDTPLDELNSLLGSSRSEMHDAAGREREQYVLMIADLEHLIQALKDPNAVIRLLEVVSRSKVARIEEDEAVQMLTGELAAEAPASRAAQLRASAASTLEQAAELLQALLGRELTKEEQVRTRFFLGVIRYRQALPRRAKDESGAEPDFSLLDQAGRIMKELAEDPQLADDAEATRWRSYASLYLGLITPVQALEETNPQRRDGLFDEAERWLVQAVTLDTVVDEEGNEISVSDTIPSVVNRQEKNIEELRTRPPTMAKEFLNDFQLSVATGVHHDSNVVLLGERTDLPRDISDPRDFGFTLGTTLDYTLGLGKIDRRLDKWTLGIRGRVAQLWHCDVDEFDEQRYGGSAALQYELLEEKESFGPVYLRMQYDYDYTLLGRSAFLDSNTLSPNVQIFWNKRRAETDLYFRYEIRNYHEPLFSRFFDRDGEYYSLGVLQSYKLKDMKPVYERLGLEPWGHKGDEELKQEDPEWPARWFEVFGGFEYSWDSTRGDEFDQKAYALTAGFIMPVPYGLDFDATFGFEWEDYAHGSRVDYHRKGRNDFIQTYGVGLSRTFVLRPGKQSNRYTPAIDRLLMTVRGHATWTLDDSNVVDRLGEAVFSYDRVLYGVTVAFTLD